MIQVICNEDRNIHGAEGARCVCCFCTKKLVYIHQDKLELVDALAVGVREARGIARRRESEC